MKTGTRKYINRIRNRAKKAYAEYYASHYYDVPFRDIPQFANPTSVMARQAVRMEINELENWREPIEVVS